MVQMYHHDAQRDVGAYLSTSDPSEADWSGADAHYWSDSEASQAGGRETKPENYDSDGSVAGVPTPNGLVGGTDTEREEENNEEHEDEQPADSESPTEETGADAGLLASQMANLMSQVQDIQGQMTKLHETNQGLLAENKDLRESNEEIQRQLQERQKDDKRLAEIVADMRKNGVDVPDDFVRIVLGRCDNVSAEAKEAVKGFVASCVGGGVLAASKSGCVVTTLERAIPFAIKGVAKGTIVKVGLGAFGAVLIIGGVVYCIYRSYHAYKAFQRIGETEDNGAQA